MIEPEVLDASLTAFGSMPSHAEVSVARLTPGQRLTRGFRGAGTFWAIAGACIFIPGLHFVLVPGFLLIGIVTGVMRVRDAETVVRVHGVCPRCKFEQDFTAGNRFAPTWRLDCRACHNHLELALTDRA
ncbi:MAG: hypothetical protein DMD77_16815 [Candidatus Rokuibacteriota bacterium]|nr:MAG: hypothetical protein DMD77_16815 [Candidatus Rokubacteria bacterium]